MLRLSDREETHFLRAYSSLGRVKGALSRLGGQYLKLRGFADKPCLLVAGYEGDVETTSAMRKRFGEIASRFGVLAVGRKAGESWLQSRFLTPYLRDPMLDRGVGVDTIETAASWSRLDGLYTATRTALETAIRETVTRDGARGVVMCHISHTYPVGASLYFTYIFPRAIDDDVAQWKTIKAAATEAILANGGTLSHHHGVGLDHLPWMAREKGELGLDVLRAVKTALDPEGIMNPGKLIP
jgi:alkyldihydroxyacetonephosphate synthase